MEEKPSAGFSLSLKCERRQQVAALRSRLFPPKQKGEFTPHQFSICFSLVTIRKGWNTVVSQREPSAGFSLSLKCERRQQVAALRSHLFPPKQKGMPEASPFVLAERVGFAPRQLLLLLVFSHTYILLIFLYFVAITPGLQTTVSSVVWSARCFEKKRVSFTSRLPTRSNPTIDEKKFGYTLSVSEFFGGKSGIRTHDTLPYT